MTSYSSVDDLMTGKIPLPQALDPQKFVDDATDEIDSYIGFTYVTPVDLTVVDRPVRLLLKRMANMLATGRLIQAASAGSENHSVHAYGQSLIKQATDLLIQISDNKVILTSVPTVTGGLTTSGPTIFNLDDESNVESFYDRIMKHPVVEPPFPYVGYPTWE